MIQQRAPSQRLLYHTSVSQMSWVRYPVWPHTFVSPSANSRGAVASYWRKYVHEVLANRLGGLSLLRKSVVRLTDRPDMTLDVYRGRKTTTTQQQQQQCTILTSSAHVPMLLEEPTVRLSYHPKSITLR